MEQPNLTYINKLARGEDSIKEELINVIKNEFPDELNCYYNSLKNGSFKDVENIVHRIKHKFSILGLEKSYENAMAFESSLREQKKNKIQKESFEDTLKSITKFLKTI